MAAACASLMREPFLSSKPWLAERPDARSVASWFSVGQSGGVAVAPAGKDAASRAAAAALLLCRTVVLYSVFSAAIRLTSLSVPAGSPTGTRGHIILS